MAEDTDPKNMGWEVLWLHEGEMHRRWFARDFAGALETYSAAMNQGRQGVTLRAGHGIPPPDRWSKIHHEDGTTEEPLSLVNAERGALWCPFCIKLRRFVYTKRYAGGPDPHMACPACGVPHWDFHVKFFNPLARVWTDLKKVSQQNIKRATTQFTNRVLREAPPEEPEEETPKRRKRRKKVRK